MGNYKFRLSDMMPNAWFYKLKDMGSSNRRRRSRNQKNTNTTTTTTTNSMKKKQPNSTPTPTSILVKTPKPNQPHHHYHLSHSRKSYYFTRDPITTLDTFYNSLGTDTNNAGSEKTTPRSPDHPPRKSPKQCPIKKTRKKKSSSAAGCNCRVSFESHFSPRLLSVSPSADKQEQVNKPRSDESLTTTQSSSFDGMVAWSPRSCVCKSNSNNAQDIVIDMDNNNESATTTTTTTTTTAATYDGFDSIPEIDLPRIITKPEKFNEMVNDMSIIKEETKKQGTTRPRTSSNSKTEERRIELKEQRNSPVRRFSGNSAGMRLRVKSPRIANMTTTQGGRRSVSSSSSSSSRRSISESFAVVKSSFNPQKDFKESMVEMIVENNIRASKDLEELLACYLSLNSDEYHDLIIKVFKQIWFDLTDIQRK